MVLGSPARGALTLWLSDRGLDGPGSWHSTRVAPGSFFDVFVDLTDLPDIGLTAGQLHIEADMAGIFTLEAVTFRDPWDPDAEETKIPSLPNPLDRVSGLISTITLDARPAWPDEFVELTFRVAPGALAGMYRLSISLLDLIWGDGDYEEFVPDVGTDYEVTVIPAPSAALLGVIGLATVRVVRRR